MACFALPGRSTVILASCLAASLPACRDAAIEVSTDRTDYAVDAGDTMVSVRLTVRNRSRRPVYLQTADGGVDVLILKRVESAGDEAWSLFCDLERAPLPTMGVVQLRPDSSLVSTYRLP